MNLHCKPGRTKGGRVEGRGGCAQQIRFSERKRGIERERAKQSTRGGEGCSLSSDDGFVTNCYITRTSENNFHCNEPPNLLPHLQRKRCFLSSFTAGFHFSPTTTDSWADWLQRKAAEANQERKEKQRQRLQTWREAGSMCMMSVGQREHLSDTTCVSLLVFSFGCFYGFYRHLFSFPSLFCSFCYCI